MGLTIRYTISYPIKNGDVVEKLETVRDKLLDYPFEEISQVEHIVYSVEDIMYYRHLQEWCTFPKNTDENLAKRDSLLEERGLDTWTMIMVDETRKPQRHEIAKLITFVGKGCESIDIILVKKKKQWIGTAFTKTQYAEDFATCHLLVIQALDILKEVGFNVKVKDEGHYWETRDLKVLAKNLEDFTTLLKAISGDIKKCLQNSGSEMSLESNIDKCENHLVVKDTAPAKKPELKKAETTE